MDRDPPWRLRVAVVGFVACSALMWPACARELDELTPYACADDGSCPRETICVPKVGCVAAHELSQYTPFPCAENADCGDPDTVGAVCAPGVGCLLPDEAGEFAPFPCDNGCGGLCCVDGLGCYPDVGGNPCSIISQSGCPGSHKCAVVHTIGCGTATKGCTPVGTPEAGVDQPCTAAGMGVDDCAAGLQCVQNSLNAQTDLTCRPLCDTFDDDCLGSSTCRSIVAVADHSFGLSVDDGAGLGLCISD